MYVIKGDPIALARGRINGKKVYDSQKHLKFMAGIELVRQHDNAPFLTGPLHLDVTFFMAMPQKMNKTTRLKKDGAYHVYVPDLDNLVKFICDVSNGILFDDDSIVASISCKKVYGHEARTEFSLSKLEQ